MRLICGLFRLDGKAASEDQLRAMAAQMDLPRLRPALALWRDGPAGFALLDFSVHGASALPQTPRTVIAADVRLDDPDAVRREMGRKAPEAEDELLMAALERHGPSGLGRIFGDFAFASWDRDAHRLVAARDVFGVRPFSYVHQPGKLFAFSSLPQALHGSAVVPKKIDVDAVLRRLVRDQWHDDSLVAGIKRLPPAHFLEVSRDGVSLTRYWQLDQSMAGKRRCTPQEAARELHRLVDQAVCCRLARTGGTGAHLSGGLDSSAVAVLAARRLRADGRALHAYSFLDLQRNDITVEDETPFVQSVLDQEGDIDWTPVRRSRVSPAAAVPTDVDKMAPLGDDDPGVFVCSRAEEQGVAVILSGLGGDEAVSFNGRGAFAEMLVRGRWLVLAREFSALKRKRGWSAAQTLSSEFAQYLVPDVLMRTLRRIAGKPLSVAALCRQTLSESSRRALGKISSRRKIVLTADGRKNRWRLATSPHIAETTEFMAQTGARHGLAFAFPLLDRRVVEYAMSLPSELFVRDGFRRRPFRDAMAGVLPERVRWRHEKYMPFPGIVADLAEGKSAFLSRIDAYEKCERVRRTLDLARLRKLVNRFPSFDGVREDMARGRGPAAMGSMAVVMRAMRVAAYIEQHGDDDGTDAE